MKPHGRSRAAGGPTLTLLAWARLARAAPEGAFEWAQLSHAYMYLFFYTYLFIYMYKISDKELIVQLLLVKDFRLQIGEVANAAVNCLMKWIWIALEGENSSETVLSNAKDLKKIIWEKTEF